MFAAEAEPAADERERVRQPVLPPRIADAVALRLLKRTSRSCVGSGQSHHTAGKNRKYFVGSKGVLKCGGLSR